MCRYFYKDTHRKTFNGVHCLYLQQIFLFQNLPRLVHFRLGRPVNSDAFHKSNRAGCHRFHILKTAIPPTSGWIRAASPLDHQYLESVTLTIRPSESPLFFFSFFLIADRLRAYTHIHILTPLMYFISVKIFPMGTQSCCQQQRETMNPGTLKRNYETP